MPTGVDIPADAIVEDGGDESPGSRPGAGGPVVRAEPPHTPRQRDSELVEPVVVDELAGHPGEEVKVPHLATIAANIT